MDLKDRSGGHPVGQPAEDEQSKGAVVIRAAVPSDWEARARLVRRGFASYHWQAFLFFFFQELTLQAGVLCGAVLFIWGGLGPAALALLLPAAGAALSLAAVALAHRVAADAHAARLRSELLGLVALAGAQLVGTVSVSDFWGSHNGGWLHLLAVDPEWRRRGVGRALVSAARGRGALAGLQSLETAVSQLQGAARTLLHAAGWEVRGTYHRPVLGAALTLPMARLGLDLPHA